MYVNHAYTYIHRYKLCWCFRLVSYHPSLAYLDQNETSETPGLADADADI